MYRGIGFKARDGGIRRQRFLPATALGQPMPPVLFLLLLAGCGSIPESVNPVDWWHDLQGGKIAEQRPPPPGAIDPYPNLATVPVRPAFTDVATRNRMTEGLVADRAHAQYEQAQAPLPDPSTPGVAPGLPGAKTPSSASPSPAADTLPPAASASLAAASAPPVSAPPASAPPVRAASNPASTGTAAPGLASPVGPAGTGVLLPPTVRTETTPGGPPPPLPQAPPPRPNLPGYPAGAGAPVAVDRLPAAAPAGSPGEVAVAFTRGSARLDPTGTATLRGLAGRRGAAVIVVVGHGDGVSPTPEAQFAALVLALARAQAMVAVLTEGGAPPTALVVDAQVAGRGAAARLLD